MSRPSRLSRRSFLRGVGGTAIALPFFEYAWERSAGAATTAPTRYIVMFGGVSAGRRNAGHLLKPGAYGASYAVTAGMTPLDARGVRDKVGVISNLTIPRSTTGVGNAPGGIPLAWHATSMGPLLSGQRFDGAYGERSARAAGQTSDQFVADAFDVTGLHYRVQAESTARGTPERGIMSWKKSGSTTAPNAPVVSATQAYTDLVGGITPIDPAAKARLAHEMARKKSAVDLALGKRKLLDSLGQNDRQRLERHFDELRSLENRLATLPSGTGEQCAAPGAKPNDTTTLVDAYTNEAERWPLLCDYIRMAFLCNQTRVATLCVTHAMSFLATKKLIPSRLSTDCHETNHSGPVNGHNEVIAWHTDVFAYLVKAFRDTTDVDGRSLLDNTAIVYLFEGGLGHDPEENSTSNSHSADDMAALVAGLAAGPAAGAHVDGGGKHPASVLLTAMNNVGVNQSALNEIGTTINALKIG